MKDAIRQHFEDYLREFVYGGIDGAVTTFAVVAGAFGASFSSAVIIVLGFANLVADGISMSVGSYLSSKSELQLLEKRGEPTNNESSPVLNGLSTFIAFVLVGLVPLLAYTADYLFELNLNNPFLLTSVLTGAAFIGIGILKSRVTATNLWRSMAETLTLGALAAAAAYVIGDFLARFITV